MKENLKLGMILFIITAVAGLLLGMAHGITEEPIKRQEKLASSAIDEVLPMAKTVGESDIVPPEGSNIREVNAGYDGDKIVGYTIRTEAKGFHGAIDMVVGISTDGKVEGIKIISHSETPGLGANIEKDSFKGQFKGKPIDNSLEVVKGGASSDNQIDAISGATISSNGVTSAVNGVIEFFKTSIKGEAPAPEKTKESLVKEILPDSSKLEPAEVEIPEGSLVKEVDKVYEGENQTAFAIKAAPEGFGGKVETVVVISLDGKIQGIRILKHDETPGLGAEAEKEGFTSQFKDKPAGEELMVGGQIDAISGATVTSDAVVRGVNQAAEFFNTKLSSKGGVQ